MYDTQDLVVIERCRYIGDVAYDHVNHRNVCRRRLEHTDSTCAHTRKGLLFRLLYVYIHRYVKTNGVRFYPAVIPTGPLFGEGGKGWPAPAR